jgi:hypothetical protein
MLTRRQELNTQLQQLIDAVLLALSLLAARTLRYYGTSWFDPSKSIDPFQDYQWLLIVVMPFGPILLDMQGFYQSPLTKTKWKSFMQIVRAMIGLSIIVSGCVIFLRLPLASRSVPLLSILIATLALLLKERVIINYIRKRAIRGELREHILLAGLPEDMANLERSFTPEQQLLMNVAGRIDIDKQPLSDLVEAMHRHSVSRVIFAADHSQLNRVEEAIGACEVEGVPAWLMTDFIHTSTSKPDFDAFAGRPMLVFRSTPEVSWALLLKGVIDRVSALVALVIMAIPMGIIALVIRITSPGPIIFRQHRAGRYGKPFVMHKFRSMANDAEMRRAELEPFNQMQGPVFKVESDPRITPFGPGFQNSASHRSRGHSRLRREIAHIYMDIWSRGARSTSLVALRRVTFEHSLQILGQNVELDVDPIAVLDGVEVGATFRVRDNPNGETRRQNFSDRQTDSIDGDGSFVGDVM